MPGSCLCLFVCGESGSSDCILTEDFSAVYGRSGHLRPPGHPAGAWLACGPTGVISYCIVPYCTPPIVTMTSLPCPLGVIVDWQTFAVGYC